ncbi:MAG TPA: hypothetical protein VK731_14370, partial [Candidatus Cybelea sp.]|nr:hypothetical protein [Candidatus Cybelea sp.]
SGEGGPLKKRVSIYEHQSKPLRGKRNSHAAWGLLGELLQEETKQANRAISLWFFWCNLPNSGTSSL